MAPFVRLVVLNHNGGDLVVRAVDSLIGLEWPPDRREIVLVDNESVDSSVAAVLAAHPEVRLIRNPEGNTGFGANNLAMVDLDDVDFVGLVNPDTTVAPDWLAHLVAALEADTGLGAACPRILLDRPFAELALATPRTLVLHGITAPHAAGLAWHVAGGEPLPGDDGPLWLVPPGATIRVTADDPLDEARVTVSARRTLPLHLGGRRVRLGPRPAAITVPVPPQRRWILQHAGSEIRSDGNAGDIGYLEPDGPRWEEPAQVGAWCGASVLLRCEYLADVGLFDESFFLYYEDTDLAWRGTRRGWRYCYVPEARAWHRHSATIGVASEVGLRHQWRNRLRMVRKNASPTTRVLVEARALASLARTAARSVLAGPRAVRRAQRRLLAFRLGGPSAPGPSSTIRRAPEAGAPPSP